MLSFILLIAGLAILVKCADIFVDGSSNIAKAFGIPSLIIGLTIVAFGTSAPEAAVSITAGLKGSNEISIGNVVGSNICNSLLILGFCGLFKALKAKVVPSVWDIWILMGSIWEFSEVWNLPKAFFQYLSQSQDSDTS